MIPELLADVQKLVEENKNLRERLAAQTVELNRYRLALFWYAVPERYEVFNTPRGLRAIVLDDEGFGARWALGIPEQPLEIDTDADVETDGGELDALV